MLSNLLSDSIKETKKHIVSHDTRNKISLISFGLTLAHNVPSCFILKQLRLMEEACKTNIEREIWNEKVQQTLYTVKTLCRYLSISRATIYRIIQRGELEPLRIGSSVRFTEIEVNRYLAHQQKQARSNEVGF